MSARLDWGMNQRIYCCKCKLKLEYIVLRQVEEVFYKYDIVTNQLSDYHGDGSVITSDYKCPFCNTSQTLD